MSNNQQTVGKQATVFYTYEEWAKLGSTVKNVLIGAGLVTHFGGEGYQVRALNTVANDEELHSVRAN